MDVRVRFEAALNPFAQVDYYVDLNDQSVAQGKVPFLEDGETIASIDFVLPPASVAMGLEIPDSGDKAVSEPVPGEFRIYPRIVDDMRQDPRFKAGVVLEIHVQVTTDADPARKKVAIYELVVKL